MFNMFNMIQQMRTSQNYEMFQEAQKRAQQPQRVMKHRKPKSLLLLAPNNMIFELFNTVIKEIPTERLVDYITQNLKDYLYTNWSNKLLQQMMRRLRREQAIDVRAGLINAPVIKFSTGVQTSRAPTTIIDHKRLYPHSPTGSVQSFNAPTQSPPNDGTLAAQSPSGSKISLTHRPLIKSTSSGKKQDPNDPDVERKKIEAVQQVYDHIMWRIQTDNVTQVTSLLIKLALDDGYKQGKLKVESFDDVWPCFEDWRGNKLIKLYAFGSAPPGDQKLVLASTTCGDLTKWVANYLDGSEKRSKPDLIRVLASSLRDKTKNCIFITNELIDAMRSLETGALRSVFLVDRTQRYEPITSMPNFSTQIEPLISSGKLYVMSSLSCVEFAPDPNSDVCC